MINELASPSVCVVDDEEDDYEPILRTLNELFVSCVHILGNDTNKLPPRPFRRLQLVFLDLHLSNMVGKNAASHTANVFAKIVSPETAPIVVVIWSKYAQVVPDGEEETEAQLFKRMLVEAEPKYKGRLIFVEMAKPQKDAQPADWTDVLKAEIDKALQQQEAVELLWTWDSFVRDAAVGVGEGLTAMAASSMKAGTELKDALKEAMQRLAAAQGEGDFSVATAPAHLVAVLTELVTDQLEHTDVAAVARHGAWLSANPSNKLEPSFAVHMNGLLLTAARPAGEGPFQPGMIYRMKDSAYFKTLFGVELAVFVALCGPGEPHKAAWIASAKPVLIEISPVCDVAQGKRVNASLVAGLIVPAAMANRRKGGGAFDASLPSLHVRWAAPDFGVQDAALVFNHLYKVTMPVTAASDAIEPWFRIRETPTASLRATQSGHASRIGFVSV
jgi:hypothetical protein